MVRLYFKVMSSVKTIRRSISPFLEEFLEQKIVLLSGPRQVGKTFLSKNIVSSFDYLNFDSEEHRQIIAEKSWNRSKKLIILDEIHKMKNWKRWLKGIYDTEGIKPPLLVTGSAKLDTYKKLGDSLAGRHLSLRLNPFSVKELGSTSKETISEMMRLGMFPEPFLSGSERKAALWRKSHLEIILRQDLIQLENVREIVQLELLVEILSQRVGSSLSVAHLAKDLSVSPHTVKNWLQILENLYVIFLVYPYSKNLAKAIRKEPKVYFYDVAQTKNDNGARLENVVALHLLKRNQFLEDSQGAKLKLYYIRDKEKREVDFLIEEGQKITHLIEVKTSDDQLNTSLNYYSKKLKATQALQLVLNLKREKDFEYFKMRDLHQFLFDLET